MKHHTTARRRLAALSGFVALLAAAPVAGAAPTGTPLDLRFRCGSATGTGVIGAPALVGSCVFHVLPTSAAGAFQVLMTPTAAFSGDVSVGYGDYYGGAIVSAVTGSTLAIAVSVTPFSPTTGTCDSTVRGTFSIPGLTGTRIAGIVGGKGAGLGTSGDKARISAPFGTPTTSTVTAQVKVEGVCNTSVAKKFTATLPFQADYLNGWYDSYTFNMTNPPTTVAVTYDDRVSGTKKLALSSSSTGMAGTIGYSPYSFSLSNIPTSVAITAQTSTTANRFLVTHNGETLNGSANLSSLGTISFQRLFKNIDIQYTKSGSNLSTLNASGTSAPLAGSYLSYSNNVGGMLIHATGDKISSLSMTANMATKNFGADVRHTPDRTGWLDADFTGNFNGTPIKIALDGSNSLHTQIIAKNSAPYVELRSTSHSCNPCGNLNADVDLGFFGWTYNATIRSTKQSNGSYWWVLPLTTDRALNEGSCDSTHLGNGRICNI